MTFYKDIMSYFDKYIQSCLWFKSEYIVVPFKNMDAQKFYNGQF